MVIFKFIRETAKELHRIRETLSVPSADYSQIELRLLAHISKDPHLIEAFNNNIDGTLKGGQKSALEALNNGVKLTPEEFESILILDSDDDTKSCIHRPIMATIVRQANELAYAIERERYRKIKAQNNTLCTKQLR